MSSDASHTITPTPSIDGRRNPASTAAPCDMAPGLPPGGVPSPAVPPLTPRSLLLEWSLDPGAALLVALAAGLYVAGVRRLRARHDRRWPVSRSAAFAGGLAT